MTKDTIDYPTQKDIVIVNEPIIGVSSIDLPLIEMSGTITVTAGRLRDAIMTDSVDKQLHEYISDHCCPINFLRGVEVPDEQFGSTTLMKPLDSEAAQKQKADCSGLEGIDAMNQPARIPKSENDISRIVFTAVVRDFSKRSTNPIYTRMVAAFRYRDSSSTAAAQQTKYH